MNPASPPDAAAGNQAGAGLEPGFAADNSFHVRDGYERWAPTYDRDPNPLLALEERTLKPLLAPLAGRRALDLGCGTGRWTAWLSAQGAASVVGIDFSRAMLRVACAKAGLAQRLVQADIRAVPFAECQFDMVICSFALGHLRDLHGLARQVARVAAPGADIYLSDLHPLAYAHHWRTGFRHGGQAVEVRTWPHEPQEVLAAWDFAGCECAHMVEARFGAPEQPIFARAGKAPAFDEMCRVPAIVLWHFRRTHVSRRWDGKTSVTR